MTTIGKGIAVAGIWAGVAAMVCWGPEALLANKLVATAIIGTVLIWIFG